MQNLADENLAAAFSFLPVDSLLQVSRCCASFRPAACADRLWLPLLDRRWRFGSIPGSTELLLPGKRQMVFASALFDAANGPLSDSAAVFDFYLRRCREESQVAVLALQLHCTREAGASASAGELHPGVVVKIQGLSSAAQYNGQLGVIGPDGSSGEGRLSVTLVPTLHGLSVRPGNLEVVGPAITAKEAEKRVLSVGADAIDALLRIVKASTTPFAATSRGLLGTLMEQWAVQQWEILKENKERLDMLEEGAFIVAQWGEPDAVNVAELRAGLASLADEVAQHTTPTASIRERVEAVNFVLGEQHGFAGNTNSYYDPGNSFMHRVLSRKRGIPISLSIVWAAVARRLAVPCHLCAQMPCHVLIRVNSGEGVHKDLFVDAFHNSVMDYDGLLSFTINIVRSPLDHAWVDAGPPSMIYARLLRNLIGIYSQSPHYKSHMQGSRDGVAADQYLAVQRVLGVFSQTAAIADDPRAKQESLAECTKLRQMMDAIIVPGC